MCAKALRIGQITYTNTLPVYYYFDQSRFEDRIDFVKQVPAQLNAAMARGEIDVGPISSFSYAEHHEHYLLLPGLSVSAKGKVGSIFLFSKRPISQLQGATIALTNTSATSVNLLKIIVQKFYGLTVRYKMMEPVLDQMMSTADAALLIGDEALVAFQRETRYHVYDLGELWHQHTGCSMTFAVWAVRKAAIKQHAELLREVYAAFAASKERSLRDLGVIARYAQNMFGGAESFWIDYFHGLRYDFSDEQRNGLETYYTCAAELGLLPAPVQVHQWEDAVRQETLR